MKNIEYALARHLDITTLSSEEVLRIEDEIPSHLWWAVSAAQIHEEIVGAWDEIADWLGKARPWENICGRDS